MRTIQKLCRNCHKEFDAPLREHNRGNAHYCSLKCSSNHYHRQRQKPKPNNTCANCGTMFYRAISRRARSKSGIFFCSRACKDQAQRIGGIKEIQPPHYGKEPVDYRNKAIRCLDLRCCNCGYHKHPEVLQVHHIDCDRTNNQLDNLKILCPTCHAEEHFLSQTGFWRKRN